VHGERRWRAALMAGLKEVPAYEVQGFGQNDGVAA
jgi:ParB-like chromosome segregation protein Spo0J